MERVCAFCDHYEQHADPAEGGICTNPEEAWYGEQVWAGHSCRCWVPRSDLDMLDDMRSKSCLFDMPEVGPLDDDGGGP